MIIFLRQHVEVADQWVIWNFKAYDLFSIYLVNIYQISNLCPVLDAYVGIPWWIKQV